MTSLSSTLRQTPIINSLQPRSNHFLFDPADPFNQLNPFAHRLRGLPSEAERPRGPPPDPTETKLLSSLVESDLRPSSPNTPKLYDQPQLP